MNWVPKTHSPNGSVRWTRPSLDTGGGGAEAIANACCGPQATHTVRATHTRPIPSQSPAKYAASSKADRLGRSTSSTMSYAAFGAMYTPFPCARTNPRRDATKCCRTGRGPWSTQSVMWARQAVRRFRGTYSQLRGVRVGVPCGRGKWRREDQTGGRWATSTQHGAGVCLPCRWPRRAAEMLHSTGTGH